MARKDLAESNIRTAIHNRKEKFFVQSLDGPSDEGLRKDFSWAYTPAIVEWERGDLGPELVEVSHEQASKIIEYFRQKWGPHGQPLDS